MFWLGWLALVGVGHFAGFAPVIGAVVIAFLAYCSVCLHIKRLHDLGRTGWWVVAIVAAWLVIVAAPAATAMFARAGHQDPVLTGSLLITGAGLIVWLGFMIWLGFVKGQTDENRYGAPPTTLAP